MQSNLDELEQALGYRFTNRPLLARAVTHSSSANEAQAPGSETSGAHSDNERLEFLGDAILGWMVSEWVFEQFPDFLAGAGEVKLVSIGNAELDAVCSVENPRFRNAFAVHPDAVAAPQVFNNALAIVVVDLSVITRDTAVAQHQMIVRRASDAEGKRMKRDSRAPAVRVDNYQRGIRFARR